MNNFLVLRTFLYPQSLYACNVNIRLFSSGNMDLLAGILVEPASPSAPGKKTLSLGSYIAEHKEIFNISEDTNFSRSLLKNNKEKSITVIQVAKDKEIALSRFLAGLLSILILEYYNKNFPGKILGQNSKIFHHTQQIISSIINAHLRNYGACVPSFLSQMFCHQRDNKLFYNKIESTGIVSPTVITQKGLKIMGFSNLKNLSRTPGISIDHEFNLILTPFLLGVNSVMTDILKLLEAKEVSVQELANIVSNVDSFISQLDFQECVKGKGIAKESSKDNKKKTKSNSKRTGNKNYDLREEEITNYHRKLYNWYVENFEHISFLDFMVLTQKLTYMAIQQCISYEIHPRALTAQIYQIVLEKSEEGPGITAEKNLEVVPKEVKDILERSRTQRYLLSNRCNHFKGKMEVPGKEDRTEFDLRNLWLNPMFKKALAGKKDIPVYHLTAPNYTVSRHYKKDMESIENYRAYQERKTLEQPGWNAAKVMARNLQYQSKVSRLEYLLKKSYPLHKYMYILTYGLWNIIFNINDITNEISVMEQFLGSNVYSSTEYVLIDTIEDLNSIPTSNLFEKVESSKILNRLPNTLIKDLESRYLEFHGMKLNGRIQKTYPISKSYPSDSDLKVEDMRIYLNREIRRFLYENKVGSVGFLRNMLVEDSLYHHTPDKMYLYPDTYQIAQDFLGNTQDMYSRFESFEMELDRHIMSCSYELLFIKEISKGIAWNNAIVRDIKFRNAFYSRFKSGRYEVFQGASHPDIYDFVPRYNRVENEIEDFIYWRALHSRYAVRDNGYILCSEDNIFGIPIGTPLGKEYKSLVPSHPENPSFRGLDWTRGKYVSALLEASPFLSVEVGDKNPCVYNNNYKKIYKYKFGSKDYYRDLGDQLAKSMKIGDKK